MSDRPIDGPGRPTQSDSAGEGHYVNPAPFDPYRVETMTPEMERYYMAPQWRLIWWKFKRHKLALISGWFLLLLYLSIFLCEFLAPYNLHARHTDFIYAPPQELHFFHEGEFVGPFVYGYSFKLNMENLRREYTPDPRKVQPLRFFCLGDEFNYWGLIPGRFHFVCPAEKGTLFLLGTDRLGRDLLSRIIYGARISLTIGLVGITISFMLGIIIAASPATTAAGSTIWCSARSRWCAASPRFRSGWHFRRSCR